MSNSLFTEERYHILAPLRVHQTMVLSHEEDYEPMTRASEIMLNSEEPSIRTYFCAKNVVIDYIKNHPSDPRGYKELGKVQLFSCVPENIDLAEQALERARSLSAQHDAEVWYLTSMCYQLRLFGQRNILEIQHRSGSSTRKTADCKQRKRLLKLAEQGLELALQYSNGSNVYRFALSDFYISINRLSKALSTLQSGISDSQRTQADAAIFHQLGRFGISCLDGLCQRGRGEKAKEVAAGALQYYRQAIEIRGNDTEKWKMELQNAQVIVDQLMEKTFELTDFALEPDFNPSGPTSLRRWLTETSSSFTQGSINSNSSPTKTMGSSQPSTTSDHNSMGGTLTEYLDTIEKQALTYEGGGVDDLIEYPWPSPASQAGVNHPPWQPPSWTKSSSSTWVTRTDSTRGNPDGSFESSSKHGSTSSGRFNSTLQLTSDESDLATSAACSPSCTCSP